MTSPSFNRKRKRTVLTLEDKIRAYNKISTGASVDDIVTEFRVSPRFVRKLRKEGHVLPKQNQMKMGIKTMLVLYLMHGWMLKRAKKVDLLLLALSLTKRRKMNRN